MRSVRCSNTLTPDPCAHRTAREMPAQAPAGVRRCPARRRVAGVYGGLSTVRSALDLDPQAVQPWSQPRPGTTCMRPCPDQLTLQERGGLGPKSVCTKNGPTRFSELQISFFPTMAALVWGGGGAGMY